MELEGGSTEQYFSNERDISANFVKKTLPHIKRISFEGQ